MAQFQRQLDRAFAVLGEDGHVGAVADQQLGHLRIVAHGSVLQRRVAIVAEQVRIEVHRQDFLRVHQIVLLDCIEYRLDTLRALVARLRFQAGGQNADDVIDERDADHGDQGDDQRNLGDAQRVGPGVGDVGADHQQGHHDEESEFQVKEQRDHQQDAEDGRDVPAVDAQLLGDLCRKQGEEGGEADQTDQRPFFVLSCLQKVHDFLRLAMVPGVL